MIPAAFDYARADSVDEAVALLAEHGDDAKLLAGGHSLLPLMKLRLATPAVLVDVGRAARPLLHQRRAATTSRSARSPATTTSSTTRRARRARAAARGSGRRGRRPAGAPPRHARRLARARRPGVRPARGRARARRHDRGARARRRARDRGHRLLRGLPRDRARARRDASPRSACRKIDGAGWAFEKFNRRAQDWAIVGVAAVARRRPGRRARQHGLDPAAGHRGRGAPCRAARRPPTPPRLAADGTEPPTDLNASPEYRRHLATRARPPRARPVPRKEADSDRTPFAAGSFVGVARPPRRRPDLLRGAGTYIDNLDVDGMLIARSCGRRWRTR